MYQLFIRRSLKGFVNVLLTGALLASAQAFALEVGETAPAFALKDQNFKLQQLDDYRGKWVVLYFYPKDDTPGCTTEACQFRDDILKIKALNAVVLGVSVDDSKSHEEFAKKYSLPFSLLADTGGKVSADYGALRGSGSAIYSKRYTFIIDPQGKIKKVYRSVNPKQHSLQIITDLKDINK